MDQNNTFEELKLGSNNIKPLNQDQRYQNAKRWINEICRELSKPTDSYDPTITVQSIYSYIKNKDNIKRILYSEISSYIFALKPDDIKDCFSINVETLLLYVLRKENNVTEDCCNIAIKIFDHVHLASNQIGNFQSTFNTNIESTRNSLKDTINNELKGIEREYVTILGIFASIVLAFVGGITFSNSVLQNIDKVCWPRLLASIAVIAFTLVNTVSMLLSFILKINDKEIESKYFDLKTFNSICILIVVLTFGAWIIVSFAQI